MCSEYAQPRPAASMAGDHGPGGAFGIAHEDRLCIIAESTGMRARGAGLANYAVRSVLDCESLLPDDVDDLIAALRRAFESANRAVLGEPTHGFAAPPDAVSAVALAFVGTRAVVAHVGNARCYRARGGDVVLLTRDHSALVALSETDAGSASDTDAFQVHNRNLLTRGLGMSRTLETELDVRGTRPGDRFLLCSSAAWSEMHDITLRNALNAPTAEDAVRAVREQAQTAGGSVLFAFMG